MKNLKRKKVVRAQLEKALVKYQSRIARMLERSYEIKQLLTAMDSVPKADDEILMAAAPTEEGGTI